MKLKEVFKQVVINLKNQKTDNLQNKIAKNMNELYGIPEGIINSFMIKNIDEQFFENNDIRLISQFVMESLKVLGKPELIDIVLTKGQQFEAKQYDFNAYFKKNKITFPLYFEPTIKINSMYSTKMTAYQIANLVGEGIINYNFDIQREPTLEIRTDKIIKKPTINNNNVREIVTHLLDSTLKESTIYLNAAPLTSDDGEEIDYDEFNYRLVINKGTRLDVLDGFHRILAAKKAVSLNPHIDFEFNVMFSNFTTSEAIKWQAQHSKAAIWSQNRIMEMQQESKASKVVKAIKDLNFEMEKLIFTGKSKNSGKDSLITFNYLEKIVGNYFDIKNRRDEVITIEQLSKILLQINDIKYLNKTFKSQNIVEAFIKLYKIDFNLNYYDFIEYLEQLYKENNVNPIQFTADIDSMYYTLKKYMS